MKYFLLAAFCTLQINTFACSFDTIFFCEHVNDRYPGLSIFTGKITDTIPYGIRFEVMEMLRGEESKDTITIWDGIPFECNGWIELKANELGKINDTIIIAVFKLSSADTTWLQLGDYITPFSIAHISSLKLENGLVNGQIAGSSFINEVKSLPYDAFKEFVVEQGACSRVVKSDDFPLEKDLNIYPNPFSTQFWLTASNNISGALIYRLTSISGQILRQDTFAERVEIDAADLPRGMYMLLVFNQKGILIARKKLVKVD